MKIGIILGTNESEIVWNAYRFANISLKANHEVTFFLINAGVDIENIKDEKFNVQKQIEIFINNNGHILACKTCLKSRNKQGSNVCSISTMNNLLKLIEKSDKVLTFG